MKIIGFVLLLAVAFTQTTVINWRDAGQITAIENMGTCRASWAFAATTHYETAFLKWGSGFTNLTLDLSEQFILQCSAAGDCGSGSVETALNFALSNGLPIQTDYAYTGLTTLYGIPLTNTSGASCTTMAGKLKKVNTTLYLNKYSNIAFSQLQSLLSNFPVVALIAVNSDFINYDGVNYPFNCTYNVTNDVQVNTAISIIGYDSNSNIMIEAPGLVGFGGSTYVNATMTGIGFGKISSIKSYCGALRHVYQYWTASNVTNNTYSYYTYERWLVAGGILASTLLLTL